MKAALIVNQSDLFSPEATHISVNKMQYLTLYSVNMTYNLKKSIIQWESVCICIC